MPASAPTRDLGLLASPSANSRAEAVVGIFFQMSLLGMLTSGFFAVLGSGELDWPTITAVLLAIGLRGAMIANWIKLDIPARWVAMTTLCYILFYVVDYLYVSQSFLTATVHLICFVAIAKILTVRTERDHTFVKLIAILELSAAAVLSTRPNFFVCLTFFLLFTIATFASGEVMRSLQGIQKKTRSLASASKTQGFSRRLGLLTCALFSGVLVLTAGMFFVLPRTARAALQRFVPQRYHLPGFANEVTLGGMGQLTQNSTPVMHVRSYQDDSGLRNNLSGVHWRGSALSRFDGKRWYNPPNPPDERLQVVRGKLLLPSAVRTRPGRTLGYEVQLDEMASDTLVFAGIPETISVQAPVLWRSSSGALRAPRLGNRGLRYGAYSFLENDNAESINAPAPLLPADQLELLQLPPLDSRIAMLARQWTDGQVTRQDQARAIENHLRRDFSYSLKLLDEPVADPLAYFLFVRKQGHCEYFASAMAVLLRSVGIPSRVATGFYGGVFNPSTGWQVVRASDAHSWVEAWIPGRGWSTFDPTPSDPTATDSDLWGQTALFFDTADQFWRDWVMDYDLDHQVVLAAQLQSASRNIRLPAFVETILAALNDFSPGKLNFNPGLGAGSTIAAILLLCAMLMLLFGKELLSRWRTREQFRRVQKGEPQPGDATILYERALRLLERQGFQKPPWLTPEEFARVLPSSELAILVEELTTTYNQVRFGGRSQAAPRLAALLGNIETLLAK